MPFSSRMFLATVAVVFAAGTAHAQPGCVGIGYVCKRSPCCNPFRCCYRDKTCPRNIKPCCVPRCPSAREEALGLSAEFLLAIERAPKIDAKRDVEEAHALEKVIFAEIARVDSARAEMAAEEVQLPRATVESVRFSEAIAGQVRDRCVTQRNVPCGIMGEASSRGSRVCELLKCTFLAFFLLSKPLGDE